MKPQTKRSFCLGVFLVIVTLVVLYSYCNGSSVCYTFPLFNGLGRDNLQAKPPAEMVVTSVIVQTKQPFDMGTINKNQGRAVVKIYHHVRWYNYAGWAVRTPNLKSGRRKSPALTTRLELFPSRLQFNSLPVGIFKPVMFN